ATAMSPISRSSASTATSGSARSTKAPATSSASSSPAKSPRTERSGREPGNAPVDVHKRQIEPDRLEPQPRPPCTQRYRRPTTVVAAMHRGPNSFGLNVWNLLKAGNALIPWQLDKDVVPVGRR